MRTPCWLAAPLLLVSPYGSPVRAQETTTQAPNVVVLFSDDAGYADFGFQSGAAADLAPLTPNIDRIAKEGITFTDFHTSGCVCSPSRAGLLTGRYQQEFGHEENFEPGTTTGGIANGGRSLADRMRAAGYTTGYVGKWHLGYRPEDHPNQRGWDWFYGLLQGSRPYTVMSKPSTNRVIQENGSTTPESGYVTDRLGDAAARFITEHKDSRFFLFVSFTAPHGPLQPREGDLALPELASIGKEQRRKYAGLVHAMDQNVGKVLGALSAAGIEKSTIVFFLNDNGGQTMTGANNGALRGKKGDLTEGGIRVPAAMRWPGRIAPGTVCRAPCIALDIAPTLLTAAGSQEASDAALDGINLQPLLATGAPASDRPLFWRRGGSSGPRAIRVGKWKLLQQDRALAASLYDISADLSESKDLAAEHPEKLARLTALLDDWEMGLIEPYPPTGPKEPGEPAPSGED